MMTPRRAVVEFARWLGMGHGGMIEILDADHFAELAECWYADISKHDRPPSPETVQKLRAAIGRTCPMCKGAGVVDGETT